jgi:peptidoglycan/xylan/chitin deacetylase (PgdA/CDA1 family)
MDKRLSGVRRLLVVSLLPVFAPLLLQQSPSTARDIVLADEAGQPSVPSATGSAQPSSDRRSTVKVPILVYHHVHRSTYIGSRAERRLTVATEIFDLQMKYLLDHGYHVITFGSLADYLEEGNELPTKPVIISFDDGWDNQYVHALPSLEKYHYIATFFVVTNSVGTPGFLSWSQLRQMLAQGMRIGSHSRSHPRLDKINNPTVLWDQIYASKQILETELAAPVNEFAYPYGAYNSTTEATVKSAGYKTARACCVGGVQSDAYSLKAVMAPNDLAKFEKYLRAQSAILTER